MFPGLVVDSQTLGYPRRSCSAEFVGRVILHLELGSDKFSIGVLYQYWRLGTHETFNKTASVFSSYSIPLHYDTLRGSVSKTVVTTDLLSHADEKNFQPAFKSSLNLLRPPDQLISR